MNKKQKGSIILASLASIAVAGSLLAGATYALFTSESKTNIAVTSGKVDVLASISDFKAHTPTLISLDGTIADDTELATKVNDNEYTFGNGGTAKLDDADGTVTLDKMTPGDEVTFTIDVANNSNVNIMYRYGFTMIASENGDEVEARKLCSALNFTLGDIKTSRYVGYKCKWTSLEAENPISSFDVTVKFPTIVYDSEGNDITNDYQDLSGTIVFLVEAIQGNAYTFKGEEFEVRNSEELTNAINDACDDSIIHFVETTSESLVYKTTEVTTVDYLTFTANEGVTVHGLQLISESEETKLTLDNIEFDDISFTDKVVLGQAVSDNGLSRCSNITFDGCDFDSNEYGIYHNVGVFGGADVEKSTNAYLDNLNVLNCSFKNMNYGLFVNKGRDVIVQDSYFYNNFEASIRFGDTAGEILIEGNEFDNAYKALSINTVGNNYTAVDNACHVSVIKNVATNMSCSNGRIFETTYDNVNYNSSTGTSSAGYTIKGNIVSYTEPSYTTNAFLIRSTYGPSHGEWIYNVSE